MKKKRSLWEDRSALLEDDSKSGTLGFDSETADRNRCICLCSDAKEIDAYRILRIQIRQRTKERRWNALMITSACPGEGKTLTAINLAATFAKSFDENALLVDGDLKRQNICQYMGLSSEMGLVDYLLDDRPLEHVIIRTGVPRLSVISGERKNYESPELLGSGRMAALVREMKDRYDNQYIFFDVPSILESADAVAFAPLIDGILMVVESGKTSVHDVKKAIGLIPQDKFLGFILNRGHKL